MAVQINPQDFYEAEVRVVVEEARDEGIQHRAEWTPGCWERMEARLHRNGQKYPVTIHTIGPGSL